MSKLQKRPAVISPDLLEEVLNRATEIYTAQTQEEETQHMNELLHKIQH